MAAIRAVSLAVSVLFFSLIAVSAAIHPPDDVTDLPASVAPHAATGMYGAINATVSLSRSATAVSEKETQTDCKTERLPLRRQSSPRCSIVELSQIHFFKNTQVV